jgi:hypothetical protein
MSPAEEALYWYQAFDAWWDYQFKVCKGPGAWDATAADYAAWHAADRYRVACGKTAAYWNYIARGATHDEARRRALV